MEIMEFAIAFWVGILTGFILRGLADKLELELRHLGNKHDGKTKH